MSVTTQLSGVSSPFFTAHSVVRLLVPWSTPCRLRFVKHFRQAGRPELLSSIRDAPPEDFAIRAVRWLQREQVTVKVIAPFEKLQMIAWKQLSLDEMTDNASCDVDFKAAKVRKLFAVQVRMICTRAAAAQADFAAMTPVSLLWMYPIASRQC